jgi:hypothetical protein
VGRRSRHDERPNRDIYDAPTLGEMVAKKDGRRTLITVATEARIAALPDAVIRPPRKAIDLE